MAIEAKSNLSELTPEQQQAAVVLARQSGPRAGSPSPAENTQRSTLQTPQGLDATHGDELFPVKREYIGINSGVRRASFK
jgi:hypothetical protein